MERSTEELEGGIEKLVLDSSLDHKGRPPLRASTGVWKASLFIVVIEFSERLSYFGLATNLIIYLTKVLHEELKTSAKNVNYWTGVTAMMPLIGGFVADAYLGRFSTVLISSIIYLAGLVLLTMTQVVPVLKPCNRATCNKSLGLHKAVFFVAMYLISIGTGGHKPSLESFGADQFDDGHAEERRKKMSYFNWWNFALCCGLLLGVTVIVYVQDNVGWGVADVVLTGVMGTSIVIFLVGRPFYRYRAPLGSPLTPMLQVLVAAAAKRRLRLPSDASQLYEIERSQNSRSRLLSHTNRLRFLDKAAIVEHEDDEAGVTKGEKQSPWRLATVTQVEETKLVLSMVPIWLTSLPFGICVAQGSTFFIKQGLAMNRTIARGFEIPPASIYSLASVGMLVTIFLYDRILVPFMRRATGSERGISILRRMGIGMSFSVLAMATAAAVETKRLRAARAERAVTVFWLVPQYMILGLGDGFTLVGLQEFFYEQVPDTMRSLGIALYLSVLGASNFLSSLLITVVDDVTERGGSEGWFAKDLNGSRLDNFYWLLAAMSLLNLCAYVYFANRYSYKSVQERGENAGSHEGGGTN